MSDETPEGPQLSSMLRDIPVRLGVELGRARMPLDQAVELGPGVVIELDRDADDPVELTVNQQRFATGQLLLVNGNEWAIRIDRIFESALPGGAAREDPAQAGGGAREDPAQAGRAAD